MTMSKLNQLRKRWQKATGEPMPEWVEFLNWVQMERAVTLTEGGSTVIVPLEIDAVVEVVPEGSMCDWDSHGEG